MGAANKIEVVLALLDKATAPLDAFNKKIDKFQAPIKALNNRFKILGESAGLGKLSEKFKGVAEGLHGVTEKFSELVEKNIIVGAIAGGVLYELVHGTSEWGDSILKSSQKVAMSTEEFSRLAYAAKIADVSQEDLTTGLEKLNKNIVGAATGSKEMQLWFHRAGVSMKDLRTLNGAQIFEKVSDAISKLPENSPRRTALAIALLSRNGASLIPMMKDGAKGIRELGDEAEKYGLVISKEAAENSEKFNDDMKRLGSVLMGVRNTIGEALMPTINALVNTFRDWILANRDLLKTRVEEFANRLAEALPRIISGAKTFFSEMARVAEIIGNVIDAVGGVGNALIIVAGIQLLPVIAAMYSLATAVGSLGATILATPIGWILAGLAAIVAIGALLYMKFDDLGDGVKGAFGMVGDALGLLWDTFKDFLKFIGPAMIPVLKVIGMILGGIILVAVLALTAALKGLMMILTPAVEAFKALMSFGGNVWQKLTGSDATLSPGTLGPPAGFAPAASAGLGASPGVTNTNNAKLEVEFKNVPKGVNVTPIGGTAPIDLGMGYANMAF